jgi:hypothetical protein
LPKSTDRKNDRKKYERKNQPKKTKIPAAGPETGIGPTASSDEKPRPRRSEEQSGTIIKQAFGDSRSQGQAFFTSKGLQWLFY